MVVQYLLDNYKYPFLLLKPMLLKNCAYLVTQDDKRRILNGYSVRIEDGEIAKVGRVMHASRGEEVIDCKDKVVLPGLINTHTHLGMHSLRGICDDAELFDWLDIVVREEKRLGRKQVIDNTRDGLREAIRFGTTSIYDSYRLADERLDLFLKMGMRGCISSTIRGAKDIRASKAFIKKAQAKKHRLVMPIIAAHSTFSVEEDVLQEVIDLSEEHRILRRLHIAETRKERFLNLQRTGSLPIAYLDRIGFLGPLALLVHCIWITKAEVRLIAKTGSKVSHNPMSNMKLASGGVMPLIEMHDEGVTVGLGTDSVVSNNNLDMFEELKAVGLLHKFHRWDPKVLPSPRILDMATIDGARCLGLDNVGPIVKGKRADIITVDLCRHMLPVRDVVSNLVYSANGCDVNDTIIDGRVVMRNKKVLV